MRSRIVIAAVTGLLAAGAGIGVSYGGGDEKGNRHNATGSDQAKQFREVRGTDTRAAARLKRTAAPCVNGMAGEFPCDGVDLLSHVTKEQLGVSFVNDIWGWTDERRERHYALVGAIEGVVFVDITKPTRPDIVGTLPTASTEGGDFWRDLKVYRDHVYIGSENSNHQLQVFDLTRLRGVKGPPVTFDETAIYTIGGNGNSHNVAINEDTGFAYLLGTSTCDGGLHMVDLSDPADPTFAGCFSDHGYVHDTQCVVYQGPDKAYRGREICFNAAAEFIGPTLDDIENTLSIVDVTDKDNPVALSRTFYDEDGYSHQGWLDPKQRFYLTGDELDEVLRGINTRTRIWDVQDLDDPSVTDFDNATTSVDHNIYNAGRVSFASNYTSGLRVYDNKRLADGTLSEVGFFDVYPENDDPTFEGGAWSSYPFYEDEDFIAVSSIDRGLFVLEPHDDDDDDDDDDDEDDDDDDDEDDDD